jgi:hypothetical protein
MILVPKNGLGVEGDDSAGLVFGDAEADVELGIGDVGPFGLGLNDEAFALSLFAVVVGDVGTAAPFVWVAGAGNGVVGRFAPLNGGIGCMYILTEFFLPSSLGFVAMGFTTEADVPATGAFGMAGGAGVAFVEAGTTLLDVEVGMRDAPGEALRVAVTPMARALVETASTEAFSRICRCFSSSLARIGTKSSGMGLFNLNVWLNFSSSAFRLSISLLTSACFFCVKRCLSFVTKSRNAGNGSAGGLLEADDVDGVGEGDLTARGATSFGATGVPSGPLTDTLGTSFGGGLVPEAGPVVCSLRAPGGT